MAYITSTKCERHDMHYIMNAHVKKKSSGHCALEIPRLVFLGMVIRVRSDFLRHPYAILHISTICPISHASINFAKFCTKNEDIAKINFSESASLRFFCLPLRQKPSLSQLLTA